MSLLSRGQQVLIKRQLRAAIPEGEVWYTRKIGGDAIDLTGHAWVGRTVFRRQGIGDAGGAAVVWGDRDYMIPVCDLRDDEGELFTPARGDRIEEYFGDEVVTFEVIAPLSEPAWRYSDQGRTVYRIHVKEVTT